MKSAKDRTSSSSDSGSGSGSKPGAKSDECAAGGIFLREQGSSDTHFVEICVCREGDETTVLVLPAKTADSRRAIAFQDGNRDGGSTHLFRLCVRNCRKRGIGDTFHVTHAEKVGRYAESPDIILVSDMFDDSRIRRARLDQRTAGCLEELISLEVAGAVFSDLAGASADHVLVAFHAALAVVSRAETERDSVDFLEEEAIVVKGAKRNGILI